MASRFGGFEFDLSSRELRKGRTRLRVPDQSLAILAMLLERPGELVTREAIQARLWPNGTVVEFEHSVNSAIKRLRQALLDTATTPRFIETLPRKGYRFIGTLEAPDDEPAGLTPGSIISHYRMLSECGRGAMGVVYKAEDTNLGRMVALKFLPDELATHPPALERLRREARMIGALNHPGICTMYELGEASGRVFLAMEFLEGETLRARGTLSESELIEIAVQVTKALEVAHGQGMVHRDIKPDNLFLTKQGVVKLMDFGLAKLVEEESGGAQQSSVTGTSGYMSPEQARGEALDARSDIYSLGKVLEELAPPKKLAPILRKALAEDPAKRWQTAGELRAALEESRRKRPTHVAAWVGVAAAVLAVAAVAFWLQIGNRHEDLKPVPLVAQADTTDATFSPDGNRVAFGSCQDKKCGIYVKQAGGGPPVRLTDGEDLAPSWSPDDRSIAFLRGDGKDVAVMLIPAIGGSARAVIRMDVAALPTKISWTPDSRWLILPARESVQEMYGIWRVSVETGERRRVIPLPEKMPPALAGWDFGDLLSSLSPDGRTLVFLRSLRTFHYDLYTVRLRADLRPEGPAVELPARVEPLDYNAIAWSGDKEIVLRLDSQDPGLFRLRVSAGATPQRLSWSGRDSWAPAVSLSKHRLVYLSDRHGADLWRRDLRTGEDHMIIGGNYNQGVAQYSPDDRRIAFQSDRSGTGLWTCEAGGENCQQLTSFGGSTGGSPRWSPDGRWLAFDSRHEGTSHIYVIGADGGQPRRLTNGDAENMVPSWSRDGRWIYFDSNRSGQWCVWKEPSLGGEAVLVTHRGNGAAFESMDGKFLYFTSAQAGTNALFRVPVGGGEEKQVVPSTADFAVTAKGVYFVLPDTRTVQVLDEKSGKISTVARLGAEHSSGMGITVSSDDHYLVFSDYSIGHNDLMLLEGFR